ncbi:hypothetical protein CAPTEDRAFT_221958 [Capitella teleta]|uniref:C2H2-type domain-containing protein n=1 Tax=Capitella teleta TaxID=283909 RepID=R7VGV0_CAPTE|nr:hypothetical protein CAPTEDRAFT_221958 [Capitella teleta]|eukprot:ELU17834.1 hypothetical protein CAPTEDRAFT_221958 [Capitella teleta]
MDENQAGPSKSLDSVLSNFQQAAAVLHSLSHEDRARALSSLKSIFALVQGEEEATEDETPTPPPPASLAADEAAVRQEGGEADISHLVKENLKLKQMLKKLTKKLKPGDDATYAAVPESRPPTASRKRGRRGLPPPSPATADVDANPDLVSLSSSGRPRRSTRQRPVDDLDEVDPPAEVVEQPQTFTQRYTERLRNNRLAAVRTSTRSLVRKYTKKQAVRHLCKICGRKFEHGNAFSRHLKDHGEEGAMSCLSCRKPFYNEAMFSHHVCKGMGPRRRGRKGHARNCSHCDAVFTNMKKLLQHLKGEHGAGRSFSCQHCPSTFTSKRLMHEHLSSVHAVAEGHVVCMQCGHLSTSQASHEEHLQIHLQSKANHVCDQCGATFSRNQQFIQHMQNHAKYDCDQCGEKFSNAAELGSHQRDLHESAAVQARKHICSDCGRGFSRPGQLVIHMRLHDGEKPVLCDACNIAFRSKKALLRHQTTLSHRKRTGLLEQTRQHLCSVCGRGFYRKQALQRHLLVHSGNKPYQCPHCDHTSREKVNLKRHVALHFSKRDFICEVCAAAFHSKRTLATHKLYKHSNSRDFSCFTCGSQFKTRTALNRHSRTHLRDRPHKCQTCTSTGFNSLYNLRRHMRAVHGSDHQLPPLKKVKLIDAPEGMEYHKSGKLTKGLSVKGKKNKTSAFVEITTSSGERRTAELGVEATYTVAASAPPANAAAVGQPHMEVSSLAAPAEMLQQMSAPNLTYLQPPPPPQPSVTQFVSIQHPQPLMRTIDQDGNTIFLKPQDDQVAEATVIANGIAYAQTADAANQEAMYNMLSQLITDDNTS